MDETTGFRLRVDLVELGPNDWVADSPFGQARGETVIGALSNLVTEMRRDTKRAIDEALERGKKG